MIKHYNCKFTWYGKEILISASITDKKEERLSWKRAVAADEMTHWIRDVSCGYYLVRGRNLVEVRKSETVSREDTLEAMKRAKIEWRREMAKTCGDV